MPEVESGWWRHCHPELFPEKPVTDQGKSIAGEPDQTEKLGEPSTKDLEDNHTASSEWKDPAKYKNRRKSECWRLQHKNSPPESNRDASM
jgi:hypothetical protein